MNDIQKVVFDSLKQFVSVCEKLELRYFLVNGSALGAKKYGGFIPWDDDLDIAMPRKDYEAFLLNAQAMLPDNIFVQNYRTDKKFPFLYTKLRNSNTAFIEKSVSHLDINHGIYIDVFPIDGYPENKIKNKILSFKIKILYWFCFCALEENGNSKIIFRNKILRFFGFHKTTHKSLRKLEKLVFNTDESSLYLCNYGDRQGKGCVLREWYGKGADCSFEGLSVKIPDKYDEYLTLKYGDWRSDLPESEQKSHHKAIICDTEKSYKEYLNICCYRRNSL